MSNRTSPSTSADLAQGHVSKKPAGAEAPVSTPGLAKGGSILSGSTNYSGTSKSSSNANPASNANNFSKPYTKDKEKTNSVRKGFLPSDGLDSSPVGNSSDSRRVPSGSNETHGEELFSSQGGQASHTEQFDAPTTDDYAMNQSLQSSPALSALTDTSSSQRGDKSITSSSFKSQQKSAQYGSTNSSSSGGATATTNRDRSMSFEKRTTGVGSRDRSSASGSSRYREQNQMHPQYHNQHPQLQQNTFVNYRQRNGGSQQGSTGNLNPNMSNNPSLSQQQIPMQQWIPSYENVMYQNHIYNNQSQQQAQIPQHQQNLAMLPHHQQAFGGDPRIQHYIGNNMVPNMQPQYPAYYQQNRMQHYTYSHNNVQPGYGYVSPDQLSGTAHQLYQQQHAMEMNAANNMGMIGVGYAALPGGQYPQYQVIQQQYGNQAMVYNNPQRIINPSIPGHVHVIPGTGPYNNSMGQPSPQSQHGQFFSSVAPLDNSSIASVQPSTTNALSENANANDADPATSSSQAEASSNSDTTVSPSDDVAVTDKTAVTDINLTQADQIQASPPFNDKVSVDEPVVAEAIKPRSNLTYKTKSGEVLDLGKFRKEANIVLSTGNAVDNIVSDCSSNVTSIPVPGTEAISSVSNTSENDLNLIPEASASESVAVSESLSSVVENEVNELTTKLSEVVSISSASEVPPQSIPAEQCEVVVSVLPDVSVVDNHPHPIVTSDLGHSGVISSSNSSNANSCNTSPRVSGLKADEVQEWRGSGRQLPPAVSNANSISTTRTKKNKKDLYAAADAKAAAGNSDLLSAYKPVVAPMNPAPVTPEVNDVVPSTEEPPAPELPEHWEEVASLSLNLNTVPTKESIAPTVPFSVATVIDGDDATGKLVNSVSDAPSRRLRPGGSMGPKSTKLNTGALSLTYSREEILSYKPANLPPTSSIPCYSSPIVAVQDGGGGGGSPYVKGQGSTIQTQASYQPARGGASQQHSYYPLPTPPSHVSKESSDSGGWERKGMPPPQSQQQQQLPTYSQSPTAQQQATLKPKVPLVKKVTDPMELLGVEVKSILNKITPQTFDKLSVQMLTLDVSNTAMLDKVIGIIFDKALDEPYFTQLYAELCSYFNKEGTQWVFFSIVKYLDDNMYFWIKDFAFDRSVAGPFSSDKECIEAVLDAEVPPPMNPPTVPLETMDIILTRDVLMKIYVQEATKHFYVTYVPFSVVDSDKRCMTLEGNIEKVRKDARNNNNFKSRLVNKCQAEFEKTTLNEKVYAELERSKQQLLTQKDSLSASEYALQEADINERQGKIKRRMLGNIRFIGELYKKGLISTKVMDSCIIVLLGSADNWKEMKDEQDIELLCKLLTTIGQTFEEKSNSEQSQHFDEYFERMQKLSKDKSLNSRMRFTIEEVIFLRKNKWQSRREQEGPLKISEIHQKIQEEEERTKMNMMSGGNKQQQMQPNYAPPMQQGYAYNHQARQQMQPQQHQQHQQHQQQGYYPQQQFKGAPITQHVRGPPYNLNDQGKFSRTTSLGPSMPLENSRNNDLRRINSENQRRPPAAAGQMAPQTFDITRLTTGFQHGAGLVNSHSQHSQYSPSHHHAPPGPAPKLLFDDDGTLRRVKGIIQEYLRNGDLSEIRMSIAEARNQLFGGYFVKQLLTKAMDSNQPSVCQQLVKLLREETVAVYLSNCKAEVEAALRGMEEIKMLADTVLDCSNAPEIAGTIVRCLVDIGAAIFGKMYAVIEEFRDFNLKEESTTAEDVHKVFGRFVDTLNQAR